MVWSLQYDYTQVQPAMLTWQCSHGEEILWKHGQYNAPSILPQVLAREETGPAHFSISRGERSGERGCSVSTGDCKYINGESLCVVK